MSRYRVIVKATGMNIPPDGVQCFLTTRFVRASSTNAARNIAIELVAESVELEPAFSSSPQPVLEVAAIHRVWSPLKRSEPNSGFNFAADEASLEDAFEIEEAAGAGWLL